MNWHPFLTKLNKIKILAETAQQEGEISRLERDLLSSYVRDLYEYLWETEQPHATSAPGSFENQRKTVQPTVPTPEPAPVVKENIVTKPVEPIIEPVTIAEPIQSSPQAPVESKPEPQVVKQAEEVFAVTESKARAEKSIDPALLAELFVEDKVSDLSDKLASQKINDLTKAMGINEKIFTIQELFNNDNNLFNQTISHLNALSDFQSAKNFIAEELVPPLDWTSEKKIKKAATFIKLVRRRYM